MTKGRTVNKYTRVYADGYDLSCDARSIGPLSWTFAEGIDDPLCQDITGVWPGQCTMSPGTLNGMFDNTTDTGIFNVLGTPAVDRDVMVALGIQAVPAAGDPVYCGQFLQDDFIVAPQDTPSMVTIKFGNNISGATHINYNIPWGVLLHENSAETSSNTDTSPLTDPPSAISYNGGWMMYQVFSGDGTATIKIEDSDTNINANFALLTGATSGVIDCSTPISGVVALAKGLTVNKYLRWQLDLGTANTVTFALAFMRGR